MFEVARLSRGMRGVYTAGCACQHRFSAVIAEVHTDGGATVQLLFELDEDGLEILDCYVGVRYQIRPSGIQILDPSRKN